MLKLISGVSLSNTVNKFFSPGDTANLSCEYNGRGPTYLSINMSPYLPISNFGEMVSAAGGVVMVENLMTQDNGKFLQCGNLTCLKGSYTIHVVTGIVLRMCIHCRVEAQLCVCMLF